MQVFQRVRESKAQPVRLVQADPELFANLPAAARREAAAVAVAPRLGLHTGRWTPPGDPRSGALGLLVIEGLLLRSVRVGPHPRSEIVGPGDLLRPWEANGSDASIPVQADWEVVEPATLAVLDRRVSEALCRWPEVVSAIVGRAVTRSRWLSLQLAITDIRKIEDRLLLLFWHLADRWGRTSPDGVIVPVRLTHAVIAQIVGAQRPTVTTGLQRLVRRGALRRTPDRTWLLVEPASSAAPGGPAPVLSAG